MTVKQQVEVSSAPGGAIDELRPSTSVVLALWFIAALGFVPAVGYVVLDPGWTSLTSLAFGGLWAAVWLAFSRPFVAVRVDGITYRSFWKTAHVPWADIDRLDVVFEDLPKFALLRRDGTLETVVVFSGVKTATATSRLSSLAKSAAPFLIAAASPAPQAEGADEPITLERSRAAFWIAQRRLFIGALFVGTVYGVLQYLDGRSIGGAVFGGIVFLVLTSGFYRSTQTPLVKSMRFDSDGVGITRKSLIRRSDTNLSAADIDRIIVKKWPRNPYLVIMGTDHVLVTIPRTLLGGRDRVALHELAAQLTALSASPSH